MEIGQWLSDPDVAESGVWHEFTEGVRLRLRTPTPIESLMAMHEIIALVAPELASRLAMEEETDETRLGKLFAQLDYHQRNRVMGEYAARTLVTDWEGFTNDGQPVACSMANRVRLFSNRPDIGLWCNTRAGFMGEKAEEATAESAKN